MQDMLVIYKKRRNLIIQLLNELPGVRCLVLKEHSMHFLILAIFRKKFEGKLLKDTFDISEYILRSSSVVTVPVMGLVLQGTFAFLTQQAKKT